MKEIKLNINSEEYQTILTAVRLEYERNYNTGTNAERLLKNALDKLYGRGESK